MAVQSPPTTAKARTRVWIRPDSEYVIGSQMTVFLAQRSHCRTD